MALLLLASPRPMHSAFAAATAPAPRPVERGRALTGRDIRLDVTAASRVLTLWNRFGRAGSRDGRSRSEARRIARTEPYRTLRTFLKEQFRCVPADADVARAIDLPDSGACGVGLDPAYSQRDAIAALVAALGPRRNDLASSIAERAAAYLPAARSWKKVPIGFVLASQALFDAATLPAGAGSSEPVILINLTDVLSYGATTAERIDALEHVLAHEVFHAGMRQVETGLRGWVKYHGVPAGNVEYIAKVMLDEGVAHYIDWQDRAGSDTLFTWKPSARETHAFSQLATALRRLREPSGSRQEKLEVLQLAGHGPLWSKYGAISGMFAAHRIEMARGRAALRRAILEGPDEFLRAYREVAGGNPALSSIPRELTN